MLQKPVTKDEAGAADIFGGMEGFFFCTFRHYLPCNCSSKSLYELERNRCCGWHEHPRVPGGPPTSTDSK